MNDELREVLKGATCLLFSGLALKQAKEQDAYIKESEEKGNKKSATAGKVVKGILLGTAAFDAALGLRTLTTVNVFLNPDNN